MTQPERRCRYCGHTGSPGIEDDSLVNSSQGGVHCHLSLLCRDRLAQQVKAAHTDNDNQGTEIAALREMLEICAGIFDDITSVKMRTFRGVIVPDTRKDIAALLTQPAKEERE